MLAVESKFEDAVIMLISGGADVHLETSAGKSALHLAAANDSSRSIEALVNAELPVDKLNSVSCLCGQALRANVLLS